MIIRTNQWQTGKKLDSLKKWAYIRVFFKKEGETEGRKLKGRKDPEKNNFKLRKNYTIEIGEIRRIKRGIYQRMRNDEITKKDRKGVGRISIITIIQVLNNFENFN